MAALGEVELEEDEEGRASARGSVCSTERRMAKLMDTVVWREGNGGRENFGGAGEAASAMVRRGRG